MTVNIFRQFSTGDIWTRNQRLGHFLALVFAAVGLFMGLNLRDSLLYETVEYFDPAAGIRIQYPVGWLIDTNRTDYLFRAQDVSRIGYRTTLQVATTPISADMSARNILDNLSYKRSIEQSQYQQHFIDTDYALPNGETATLMEYVFVVSENNPFQRSLPETVIGRDILIIRRGQGILITFVAAADTYEADLAIFDRFMSTLSF